MSDRVTLSATVSATGEAFSGSLQFQVAGSNIGAAVPVNGSGVYTTIFTITNASALRANVTETLFVP